MNELDGVCQWDGFPAWDFIPGRAMGRMERRGMYVAAGKGYLVAGL